MKMFAMQPLLAVAALWLFPLMCTAVEMESEAELSSDEELVGSTAERSEKKEAFTPKECLNVVKKVQESGRYTEESIVPVCNDVMGRSSNCEFFAEALSLASSHTDFQGGETFCEDMDRAQFCSEIMDKLLQSTAVSDLAFGECERAKPQKNVEYCRRIQRMLGLSVKQEDLDTMRACYMMEAYTNNTQTGNKALEANEASPQMRIITGGNKELDTGGKGAGQGHPPNVSNIGRAEIVLQPAPLENFGKGKGNITKPKGIITEPNAAGAAPAPAAAAPLAAGPTGPILAEPIPAPAQEKSQLQTSNSKAKVVMSSDVKQNAQNVHSVFVSQPLVAQAIMQNGTLVMTGTAFGTVKVDGSAIAEALRKQAVAPEQVLAIKQPTSVKPAPATKQNAVPKQVAPLKTAPVQPAKVKVGLLVAEPPLVVAVNAPKPAASVAQPPAPVAQPAAAASPKALPSAVPAQQVIKVIAQPAAVAQPAAAEPKAAPSTVPAQQVITHPAQPAVVAAATAPKSSSLIEPAQQVIQIVLVPPPPAAQAAAPQPSARAVAAAPQLPVKVAAVRVAPPASNPAQPAVVAAATAPKSSSLIEPAQQVIKIALVADQAAARAAVAPRAARPAAPQPAAPAVVPPTAPQAARPAAPQPVAPKVVLPTAVPQAAQPAAPQPVAPTVVSPAALPQAARTVAPQPVARAGTPQAAPIAAPKPSVEVPVARVAVPVSQPALQPARQPIIQAVLQVHVHQAGPQPAAVKAAHPSVKAPTVTAAKPSTQAVQAPVVVAAKPATQVVQAPVVMAAKPAQVVQAPVAAAKSVAPAAAKVAKVKTTSAVASNKQPSTKQAAPVSKDASRPVSKHNAGLAQGNTKKSKVEVEKKVDAYAGFLSKFVA